MIIGQGSSHYVTFYSVHNHITYKYMQQIISIDLFYNTRLELGLICSIRRRILGF